VYYSILFKQNPGKEGIHPAAESGVKAYPLLALPYIELLATPVVLCVWVWPQHFQVLLSTLLWEFCLSTS